MKRQLLIILLAVFGSSARARTPVTYNVAKSTSSYYQMAVEIAEAEGRIVSDIIVTVEESQGSVQNVMEAIGRTNNTTTPPVLIKLAQGASSSRTRAIRVRRCGHCSIPSLTMHFVMSEGSG